MKYKSIYKNLIIIETNIRFSKGEYETENQEEIKILNKTKGVTQIKENKINFDFSDRILELNRLKKEELQEFSLNLGGTGEGNKEDLIKEILELETIGA